MTNWDNIVTDSELTKTATLRRSIYYEKKDYTLSAPALFEDGWEQVSVYKNERYSKYRKEKSFDEKFEDSVWTMFAKMGFSFMNRDRNFHMSYDSRNPALTQQIDIFAVEEETIFIVECKSSETTKPVTFKKEIEALNGQKEGLMKEARKQFPNKKVVFAWATKNCILGQKDKDRLTEWGILHFDDSVIQYYTELANHLGTSARYQLLGNVLKGKEIKSLNMDVPAIHGKMGNNDYYAFSIEPEKLLKIGYVLHRTKANADMMPTYQRIIKKQRLTEIRKFVDNGGYFPNSIIVSIDTYGRPLDFSPAAKQVDGTRSKIGILHLPNKYHSAYIIDGQHRLYGYSDSKYAGSDCIPVVAFVNLDRQEQLKLFIDINENQKAVPKGLRSTLNKDVYWDSKNKNEQRIALRSKIAQALGEDSTSPLMNRVIIGEEGSSEERCINIDYISSPLNRTQFLNTYDRSGKTIKSVGTFDFDNNDKTFNVLFPFLRECFRYMMEQCPDEWAKGKSGILTLNRGIQALLMLFNDITKLLVEQEKIHPLSDSLDTILAEVEFYLKPLADHINTISDAEVSAMMGVIGTNGPTAFWRHFQKAINNVYPDFNPPGMVDFFENQSKKYNDSSRHYLIAIERQLRSNTRQTLMEAYGRNWQKDGVPKEVLKRIATEAVDKRFDPDTPADFEEWDLVTFQDILRIATYQANWQNLFKARMIRPEESDLGGRREDRLAWIETLDSELSNLEKKRNYSVKKDSYDMIESVYNWVCAE